MKKLLAVVLTLAMLCSVTCVSFAEEYDYASTVQWDDTYDVVVIGLGLAGATTAITAADLGAKVLVTEKAPEGHEGGNSKYAGQVAITPLETSHEEFSNYYNELMNDYPDAPSQAMIDAYFDKASKNEQWLTDRFNDIGEEVVLNPFKPDTGYWDEWPEIEGAAQATRQFSPGRAFSGCLFYLAEDNVMARSDKVDVWFESPAKHLIQDPLSKEILGVQIEKEGKMVNVRATAGVVMCCGGFHCSVEKMATYLHAPYTTNQGGEYNTGDGIDMAIEVGAQLWHMDNAAGFVWCFENPDTHRTAGMGSAPVTKGILVGSDGTRFLSETAENRHGKVKVGGRWVTMPTSDKNFVIMDDTAVSAGKLAPIFSDGNAEEIEKGWVIKADTIEELAEKIGCEPATLRKTVDRWNGFVDGGEDLAFDRDMTNAPKIEKAPFYAMQIKPTQYNTQGGAKRNENAEVLNTMDQPIPHLYSAGEFGSMFCDKYNGGSNLAECIAFGQIAGESACKNLQK